MLREVLPVVVFVTATGAGGWFVFRAIGIHPGFFLGAYGGVLGGFGIANWHVSRSLRADARTTGHRQLESRAWLIPPRGHNSAASETAARNDPSPTRWAAALDVAGRSALTTWLAVCIAVTLVLPVVLVLWVLLTNR